jgi:hypothetical protein
VTGSDPRRYEAGFKREQFACVACSHRRLLRSQQPPLSRHASTANHSRAAGANAIASATTAASVNGMIQVRLATFVLD